MKKLTIYITGVYIAVATWLATPTVMEWVQDHEYTPVTQLDAGGSDEQWEFLKDYALLIQYAEDSGYKLTAGELYRTMYQQRKYVRDGLSWTYNSYHLKRKAGDFNLFINGKYITHKEAYKPLGIYWESLSPKNRWGGRFNDSPHMERMDRERTEKENNKGL